MVRFLACLMTAVMSFLLCDQVQCKRFNLNELVSNMKCKDGFQQVHSSYVTCRGITVKVPVCKPKNCTDPKFPQGLKPMYTHGTVYKTYCSSTKHHTDSLPYSRCDHGTWSPPYKDECIGISISIERSSSDCGKMHSSNDPPGGEFMSAGYSKKHYPANKKCTWKITSNTRIGLYFKTFDTESGYDYVKVYDGDSESSPLIGSYSGNTLPPYITSSARHLFITFKTDGSGERWGFSAHFDAMDSGIFRLVNGTVRSGRLEFFYGPNWGTVCDDYWDIKDATVACKQLGFPGAIKAYMKAEKFGQGKGNIWLNNHFCQGNESHIIECSYTSHPWKNHSCTHDEDAGVECQKNIRLVNGGGSYGRVEVYHQGQWGTICQDGWDMKDANVVCRELGFSGATEIKTGAYYGQGSGPIWMDEVECLGTEKSLMSCGFRGWLAPSNDKYCTHAKDAGVRCH